MNYDGPQSDNKLQQTGGCQAVGKVCSPAGQRLPFLSPSPQGGSGPQQNLWCSLLQGGSPRIHRGRPFTAEQILWGRCVYSPFTAVGRILSGSRLGNSSAHILSPGNGCMDPVNSVASLDGTPGVFSAVHLIHSFKVPSAWEEVACVTRGREVHLVVKLLSLIHYFCEFLRGHASPGV